MKNPSPKLQAQASRWQAELARRKREVEKVWSGPNICLVCRTPVSRPQFNMTGLAGYIHWKNPAHVEAEGAWLCCAKHHMPQVIIK